MKFRLSLAVSLACGLAAALTVATSTTFAEDALAPPAVGSVTGKVLFDGGKAPKGIEIKDTIVFLEGKSLEPAKRAKRDPAKGEADAVMDQVDITYDPHVLPVLAGDVVEFRNSDQILHNVHGTPRRHDEFNRATSANTSFRLQLTKPEIFHIGCDIHSQMSAWVLVLRTPFHARAGKRGTYAIKDIPPGTYKLVAWHEKYGKREISKELVIEAGKAASVQIDLQK